MGAFIVPFSFKFVDFIDLFLYFDLFNNFSSSRWSDIVKSANENIESLFTLIQPVYININFKITDSTSTWNSKQGIVESRQQTLKSILLFNKYRNFGSEYLKN